MNDLHRELETLRAENQALQAQLAACQTSLERLTDLQSAEQRFRTLYEQSPLPIALMAPDGLALAVNPAWEKMFGVTQAQLTAIGYNVLHDPQTEALGVRAYLQRGFAGESVIVPPVQYDTEKTIPGGLKPWTQLHIQPLKDDQGQVQEVVFTYQNLSEVFQAELEKQAAIAREQEKAAQERAAELAKSYAALKQALDDMAQGSSLDNFLAEILRVINQHLDTPGSMVWLYDFNADVVNLHTACLNNVTYYKKLPPSDGYIHLSQFPLNINQDAEHLIQNKSLVTLNLPDIPDLDAGTSAWLRHNHIISVLRVPLVVGKRVIGNLTIHKEDNEPFPTEKIELAKALGQQAALSIHLTRLAEEAKQAAIAREQEKAAQERAAELAKANEALRRSARNIAQNSNIEDILPLFLREAITVSGASAGAVLQRVGASEFEFVAILQDKDLIYGKRLKEHPFYEAVKQVSREDPNGWFTRLATGETLWRLTDDDQAGTLPESGEYHRPHQQRSVWDIPYKIGDQVAGYLGLAFRAVEGPSQVVAETVSALATQVGLALELTKLAEEAKQAAIFREQEKAAQAHAAHLARANAALQKTIDALGKLERIEAFIPAVLKIVAENFQATSCSFFEVSKEGVIYLRYWLIEGQIFNPDQILAIDPNKYALIVQLAGGFTVPDAYLGTPARQRTHAVQLDHAAGTCIVEFDDFCRVCGWESELNVPCVIGDAADGGLVIYRGVGLPYTESEISLAETLSAQLAMALQASRLAEEAKQAAIAREQEKAAQERAAELAKANAVLTGTLDRLAKAPDPNAFLGYLLLEIAKQIAACKVHLFLYDAPTNTLTQQLCVQEGRIYYPHAPNDPPMFRAPFAADITPAWQFLIERREMIVSASNYFTEMHWPDTIPWHRSQGHSMRAASPLIAGEQPIGMLTIAFREKQSLQHEELELLRALANQATLAIQLTRLTEESKQTAIAREQEKAAQVRAAELVTVNEALRQREQQIQQSYRFLSVVAQMTKTLLEAENIDTTIPEALQSVAVVSRIHRILLFLERQSLITQELEHYPAYHWAEPGFIDSSQDIVRNSDFISLIQLLKQGQSIWNVTTNQPQPIRKRYEELGIQSSGVVPVFIEAQYVGCLAFDDCMTPRQWSQQELDVFSTVAESIGAALHRKQLTDRLIAERIRAEQERAAELAQANAALKRSLDALATDSDLNQFAGHILKVVAEQLDAPVSEYWSTSGNVAYLELSCWHGNVTGKEQLLHDPRTHGIEIPPEMIAHETLEQRQRHFIVDDLPNDPVQLSVFSRLDFDLKAWCETRGVRQHLNIPLQLSDQAIGALTVYIPANRAFTKQQIELAYAFAQQITLAIQLTRLAEEAKQAAIFEERNRMAREIHDTLAQAFGGILMQLQAADYFSTNNPAAAHNHCHSARQLAQEGLAEARRTIWLLYQDDIQYRDLATLIAKAAAHLTANATMQANVTIAGTPYHVEANVGINLLRLVQESITNALRHAQAQTLQIDLTYTPISLQLTVCDDGRGFDPQQTSQGFGLTSMQQRAKHIGAQFHIKSHPATGTEIRVVVPIPSK